MLREEALKSLIPPGQRRPGKQGKWGGVMQIHVTRACDRACPSCTQGSNLGGKTEFITTENFEKACKSLKGYFGIVALFGGNPALAPNFNELCEVLRAHFPKKQCGIWCNNPKGKAGEMARTFDPNHSNLNCHANAAAYAEFKRDWPKSQPFNKTESSRHAPVHLAMKDLDELPTFKKQKDRKGRDEWVRVGVQPNTEEGRWSLIGTCDLNKFWSAMVCQIRGDVYGYFCEIAGAQAVLHQDDPDWPLLGLKADQDYGGKKWWQLGMDSFAHQADFHCHRCGVPLRGYGALDTDDMATEQTSATHAGVFKTKKKGRPVQVVTRLEQLNLGKIKKVTDYKANAGR